MKKDDMRFEHFCDMLFVGKDILKDHLKVFPHLRDMSMPFPPYVNDKIFGQNFAVSEQSTQTLTNWNQWDIQLYQFAKKIMFQRLQAVVHPQNHTLSLNLNDIFSQWNCVF
ncbi:hypothetical protein RFI_22500 [Reticulomyxa filosa]|uniref:Uncharacterized protein n=1 Tax=Reticulomyxa filosa TaxID=46433 RepID=X6MM20_RETFI|nr:hypothetical protein RFI_22500 [Reticulomyxa filosa]|eukprot:ETO14864.1 hypothetical protein RFI_22500 [Reticulomyxa filosa]